LRCERLRARRFQSAPPVRGAMMVDPPDWATIAVSIRAPRAGGDSGTDSMYSPSAGFNPRPPCGGR